MSHTLDARQMEEFKSSLKARARQLREEIRQTLLKSDHEQYAMIGDQVRDLEDDSFADLMVDVNLAEIDRDLHDETEEAISKRLDTYNEKTAPLANFYRKERMLMDVNATSSDTVVSAIRAKVGI